eukprot:scaffold234600_cov17-Tisochrysis_lutea.AAC.1
MKRQPPSHTQPDCGVVNLVLSHHKKVYWGCVRTSCKRDILAGRSRLVTADAKITIAPKTPENRHNSAKKHMEKYCLNLSGVPHASGYALQGGLATGQRINFISSM